MELEVWAAFTPDTVECTYAVTFLSPVGWTAVMVLLDSGKAFFSANVVRFALLPSRVSIMDMARAVELVMESLTAASCRVSVERKDS